MSSSTAEPGIVQATHVAIGNDTLSVDLSDGRALRVPLSWFPRLLNATAAERANWQLIGGGSGIHWPDVDEDISLDGLLAGRRSGESQGSLERWLATRARRS